jgi:hypothetical protein
MPPTPVFIKIEQYKELTEILSAIDQKIGEAAALLSQLDRLKAEEDAQLQAWAASLEEIKGRSEELHTALFLK